MSQWIDTCGSRSSQRYPVATVIDRLLRRVSEIWQRWRARRDVRQLLFYPDATLKDMGLSRTDVEGEMMKPIFRRFGGWSFR
jgi:uncharacterized protein YjiS (DUF1127 family)